MYKIKNNIELKILEKYGFKVGNLYPDYERCICNDYEHLDYWLIPMNPDEPDEIYYADTDFDQPIWSVHIQSSRRIWIECVPPGTYHIDNSNMEYMFFTLRQMILDGIIEDDYMGEKE